MELYYIWLESIKGLGPISWHMLLEEFGTPYDIYMNRNYLSPQGKITAHCLNLIRECSDKAMEEAKKILENCVRQGIHIVKYKDQQFAHNIRENQEFPIMFYYKGTIREGWTHGAGIVGARRCSRAGKECAIRTAIQSVENQMPVISGMAKGIDAYSHTAAINHGGYAIAVLGFGIDQCYPVEHMTLKERIARDGLLISEYPPGTAPLQYNFPRRNRIIAGLSDVLYVIDGGAKSGTNTTIKAAQRYGKEIRCFPCPWTEKRKD